MPHVPAPVEALVQKALDDCGGDPRLALYALAFTAYAAFSGASAGMLRLNSDQERSL